MLVKEKDVKSIIKLLPNNAHYYLCSPSIERALPLKELIDLAEVFLVNYSSHISVSDALDTAKENSKPDDLIIVSGSTFVVEECCIQTE